MKPDEWREGIENEAASVEDRVWAGEAQRVARVQRGTRTLLSVTTATLLYVLIGSLLIMAFNALSIGYGPQGLRPIVLGSPLPSFLTGLLIPFLTAVYLIRLGIRPALVWLVPVIGGVLGMLLSRVLTIGVPMNFPDAISSNLIDLLPSGSPSLPQILSSLLLQAVAVGLGISLGRRLHRRRKTTLT